VQSKENYCENYFIAEIHKIREDLLKIVVGWQDLMNLCGFLEPTSGNNKSIN
jgi:hypothetical protein